MNEYISIQDRIKTQLPCKIEEIALPFLDQNTIKYALKLLIERKLVDLDEKRVYRVIK